MQQIFKTILFVKILVLSSALFAQNSTHSLAQDVDKYDPEVGIQKFSQFYQYLNTRYVDTVHNGDLIDSAIVYLLNKVDPNSTYLSQNIAKDLSQGVDRDDPRVAFLRFVQFDKYLNTNYIDSMRSGNLRDSAIVNILGKLDPHSTYFSVKDMLRKKEYDEGGFIGIGVEFNILNDTVIVVKVMPGGPSEKAGIIANDRIVMVNGRNMGGVSFANVPTVLRGPKGTKAEIIVVRPGEKDPIDFSVVRSNVGMPIVDAAYKIDDKTGYIHVNRFANTTYKDVADVYAKMGDINALILDLRGNGGGFIDQAVALSGMFLPHGSLVVSTEGMRSPTQKWTTQNDWLFKGKLVVLTDESSASASEIVAGAIQDWDRGLIVGRHTFGKGLVQNPLPLSDGSSINLTTARYYTPSGRMIQRSYQQGQKKEYYQNYLDNYGKDDFIGDSTKAYKTLQLGRKVYGGGGIIPDVVVKMDTTVYNPKSYFVRLIQNGVINNFVIEYMDENRKAIEKAYPDVDSFVSCFDADQALIDQLVAYATTKGVKLSSDEELAKSLKNIKISLKSVIASKRWSLNEFYMVVNSSGEDTIFDKGVDVLRNWDKYVGKIMK